MLEDVVDSPRDSGVARVDIDAETGVVDCCKITTAVACVTTVVRLKIRTVERVVLQLPIWATVNNWVRSFSHLQDLVLLRILPSIAVTQL